MKKYKKPQIRQKKIRIDFFSKYSNKESIDTLLNQKILSGIDGCSCCSP